MLPGKQTPCVSERRRFDKLSDDLHTRQLCWGCFRRPVCAVEAVEQVELGLHPTGVRAGVFLPDDKRADGDCTSPERRQAIEKLRSVAAVLNRAK